MKRLNKKFIQTATWSNEVSGPVGKWDTLPAKVLQFGTGVLLRGLPDFFIDKANKEGVFNGRVVVVKSTIGKTDGFAEQDGLYTICVKGLEEGKDVEELIVNASIKEVLSAADDWDAILDYAKEPEMKIVISNTTEVGIVYDKHDRLSLRPPASFPAKLLAFLYERYQHFGNDSRAGMVILPTELITDNGVQLKEIVIRMATEHQLDEEFIYWLTEANHFCNTLVDRIVPGPLPFNDRQLLEQRLGYQDELMIMAEPFRLWAVEASHPQVEDVLSFSRVDKGMVIAPDINKYRELKLRLLNGTHTFACGLAMLSGYETVKETMEDPLMENFIRALLMEELVPTLTLKGIDDQEAKAFANEVLDRFRNKSLDHKWLNITLNYSSKMEMRNVSTLIGYHRLYRASPTYMALGFAAYLRFMKGKKSIDTSYKGYIKSNGYYPINDEYAGKFDVLWHKYQDQPQALVHEVLRDQSLWKVKLDYPDFERKVAGFLEALLENDPRELIREASLDATKYLNRYESKGS